MSPGPSHRRKGRTCLFLGEEWCYSVNEMGVVQGRVKELRDRNERHRKELQNLYSPRKQFPWLLPPGLPPEPPPIPSFLHCPLLAELHNALDTKIGDILTSAHFDYKLSPKLNEDMEQVTEFFVSVQRQINSLASAALQNR